MSLQATNKPPLCGSLRFLGTAHHTGREKSRKSCPGMNYPSSWFSNLKCAVISDVRRPEIKETCPDEPASEGASMDMGAPNRIRDSILGFLIPKDSRVCRLVNIVVCLGRRLTH